METKKILVGVATGLIATASIAGFALAADTATGAGLFGFGRNNPAIELTDEQKMIVEQHKLIMAKVQNGESLSEYEQSVYDGMNKNGGMCAKCESSGKGHGKGKHGEGIHDMGMNKLNFLTDTERAEFDKLSTIEEKNTYIDAKREEQFARMQAHELVIDKLLKGEKLTSEEELMRKEIIEMRANRPMNGKNHNM